MKYQALAIILALSLSLASHAAITTHYVDASGTNPVSPYIDWSTAATNIQDAIGAAGTMDRVLVTNGVYRFTSRIFPYTVAFMPGGLTLESVNGPTVTIIDGQSSNHCVYLGSGAILSGFTVTNGHSDSTSSLHCETLNSLVSNCVVVGNNKAYSGGSAIYSGRLVNCGISNNLGGGAESSTLSHCTLVGDVAQLGGGAFKSTLINCALIGNSATGDGGGANQCTLLNCVLTGNRASYIGGGAGDACYLANCVLFGNYSTNYGGGAGGSTLVNCTIVSNSAKMDVGGAYACSANNSILYYNDGSSFLDNDFSGISISNCCTPRV